MQLRPPLQQRLCLCRVNTLLGVRRLSERHQLLIRGQDREHGKHDQAARQSGRSKNQLFPLLPVDTETLGKGVLVVARVVGKRKRSQSDRGQEGKGGDDVARFEGAFPESESLGEVEVDVKRGRDDFGALGVEEVRVDQERVCEGQTCRVVGWKEMLSVGVHCARQGESGPTRDEA